MGHALAVFGAPNDLTDHADAALKTALVIDRLVGERFGQELRIGIGINTGVVIAGTIGGGGKLEFTLIGNAVNVAARVEQLTKITGDAILLTQQCLAALVSRPPGLVDRGSHTLKGKSAPVQIFCLSPDHPQGRRMSILAARGRQGASRRSSATHGSPTAPYSLWSSLFVRQGRLPGNYPDAECCRAGGKASIECGYRCGRQIPGCVEHAAVRQFESRADP